jgi:hypothetical protein
MWMPKLNQIEYGALKVCQDVVEARQLPAHYLDFWSQRDVLRTAVECVTKVQFDSSTLSPSSSPTPPSFFHFRCYAQHTGMHGMIVEALLIAIYLPEVEDVYIHI